MKCLAEEPGVGGSGLPGSACVLLTNGIDNRSPLLNQHAAGNRHADELTQIEQNIFLQQALHNLHHVRRKSVMRCFSQCLMKCLIGLCHRFGAKRSDGGRCGLQALIQLVQVRRCRT